MDRAWKGARDHGPLEFWQLYWWDLFCKGLMRRAQLPSRTVFNKNLSSSAEIYFSAAGYDQPVEKDFKEWMWLSL